MKKVKPGDFDRNYIETLAKISERGQYEVVVPERLPCMMDWRNAITTAIHHGTNELLDAVLANERCLTYLDEGLYTAVRAKNPEVLKKILDTPKQISEFDIQFALESDCAAIVEAVLSFPSIDPTVGDHAAISMACRKGRTDIVRLLLADSRIMTDNCEEDLSSTSSDDSSASHYSCNYGRGLRLLTRAVENGHHEVVKLLLQDERPWPKDIDEALLAACNTPCLETLKILLDYGPREHLQLYPPLRAAVTCHNFAALHVLLTNKSKVSDTDIANLLHHAAHLGCLESLKILLADERFDPSQNDNIALRTATQERHLTVVEFLLGDERVNPTPAFVSALRHYEGSIYDLFRQHPRLDLGVVDGAALLFALPKCPATVMQDLLANDRVKLDDEAYAQLLAASEKAYACEVYIALLERRTDINNSATENCRACASGDFDTVERLLAIGSVGPREFSGIPFLSAVRAGHTDIVNLLLGHGEVDPTVSNNAALQSAILHDHLDMVTLLVSHSRVDPTPALRWAVTKRHLALARTLINDQRIPPRVRRMKKLNNLVA